MTDPTPAWQPALPGLTPPRSDPSALVAAAVATIRALEDQGLLEPRHALQVQAILSLAEQIGADRSGKFTVAVGQGWRTLLDAIEQLPQPTAERSDEWDAMARAFAEADAAARAAVAADQTS